MYLYIKGLIFIKTISDITLRLYLFILNTSETLFKFNRGIHIHIFLVNSTFVLSMFQRVKNTVIGLMAFFRLSFQIFVYAII